MKYVKWNFLTTENAGATHSNAFTVSTASVHLPIFLVEYRWLICCWKCSQIQADFCSIFFSSYLLDYPCMQQKVPVQPVIGYHRPMVGLLHIFNILVISITKWKLWVFCVQHQLGAYSKIFRMHKALNPLPSTGAFLCLMLRHLLELGKVATAGSLPIHLEILQKLKT
jgi:hypothetical protein